MVVETLQPPSGMANVFNPGGELNPLHPVTPALPKMKFLVRRHLQELRDGKMNVKLPSKISNGASTYHSKTLGT